MKRKKMAAIAALLGIILFHLPANLQAQVLEQTFSESAADFSITSPNSKWLFTPRSITPGPLRATLRFQSPVNKFIPNVTVRVLPVINPETNVDKLVEEDLKSLPPEIEVLEKIPLTHQNWKGVQIQLLDPKAQVRFFQWVFLEKGKSFILTGVAKDSSWPRLEGDIKMILNSFEIR